VFQFLVVQYPYASVYPDFPQHLNFVGSIFRSSADYYVYENCPNYMILQFETQDDSRLEALKAYAFVFDGLKVLIDNDEFSCSVANNFNTPSGFGEICYELLRSLKALMVGNYYPVSEPVSKIHVIADGSYPTYEELFEQTFAVLSKHPNLKVCFAHFLFLENEPEKLEEIFAKYKNVYVDIVPGLMFRRFEERPEYFKDFLTKHSDRIIFGSDAEITVNSRCAELISAVYDGITTDKIVNIWGYKSKGIDLPDEVSGKILFDNFKVLCHNTPKTIDKTALKAYIEKYSVYLKDSPEKTEILKFAQNSGGI